MSAIDLGSRAIVGMYYEALEALAGTSWVDAISNYFTSDQDSETYKWLGMPPALREWVGGRQAKGFTGNGISIENKHYEATIEFLLREMRRDKTGQIMVRISEFAQRGDSHFASLLSTLVINAEATACYDGQYFFDTDHSEGDSGSQSNDITTDISALPAQVHGSTTVPSPEEMQHAIQKSITQMHTLVDDRGEPLNEGAAAFHVMVPNGLAVPTRSALSTMRAAGPATVDMDGMKITMSVNPRLTTGGSWTDKFVTCRTDGSVKPFIRQEETTPQLKVKGEDSEYAFDNDAIQIGIDTWRNVGYGRWQGAVLNQLV